MTNPLDEYLNTYKYIMAAIKVARRAINQFSNPLSNTDLYFMKPQEKLEMLDQLDQAVKS